MAFNKFEEYKFIASSNQHLSERRQEATKTYLSVNTAIFVIIAFLIKDTQLQDWWLIIALFPLTLTGILSCWIWSKIITQYKKLIGWRYDELIKIEESMKEAHHFYKKEKGQFFKQQNGKEKFGFSRLEALLPTMFMALYLIYFLGLLFIITYNQFWR
ncbi:MAG: hypothetical protein ACE5JB_00660 [bacterium]